MVCEVSLLHVQEPTTRPYPKPNECSLHWLIIFKVVLMLISHLGLFQAHSFRSPTLQNPVCISVIAHVSYLLLDLITIIVFGNEKNHESLDSKIFFTLQGLCSSSYVRNHIVHPHKT